MCPSTHQFVRVLKRTVNRVLVRVHFQKWTVFVWSLENSLVLNDVHTFSIVELLLTLTIKSMGNKEYVNGRLVELYDLVPLGLTFGNLRGRRTPFHCSRKEEQVLTRSTSPYLLTTSWPEMRVLRDPFTLFFFPLSLSSFSSFCFLCDFGSSHFIVFLRFLFELVPSPRWRTYQENPGDYCIHVFILD